MIEALVTQTISMMEVGDQVRVNGMWKRLDDKSGLYEMKYKGEIVTGLKLLRNDKGLHYSIEVHII